MIALDSAILGLSRMPLRNGLHEHCATPVRHMQVGLREDHWTDDEWRHLARCQRCCDIQLEVFRSTRGRARILIADDSRESRLFVEVALKKLHLDITSVDNGTEALALAQDASSRDERYDMIVLDLRMPGLDGCEVARALRTSGYPVQPVLILTAYPETEGLNEQCQEDDLVLLSKPIGRARLASHVERALAGIPTDHLGLPA